MCEISLHYHKIVIACKIISLKTEGDKERVYNHLTAVSMHYGQGYFQAIQYYINEIGWWNGTYE